MLNILKILHLDINMINEKMIELLLLNSFLSAFNENYIEHDGEIRVIKKLDGTNYNIDKMQERAEKLVEEFIKPYAI